MEIILKSDIERLGKAGELVSVKRGFARNFLFPKGLALQATPVNLKLVEQEKVKIALRQENEKKAAQELAQKISSASCTIAVEAGPDGRLYGSVTNQDISGGYRLEGIDIDKRKIALPQPIKEVGVFKVNIKLHPEVTAEAKVWIVKTN